MTQTFTAPVYADCQNSDGSYDQDKLCEAIYQEYLAYGLATGFVDRERLNLFYREAYKVMKESISEAPAFRKVVWVNSPLAGCYLYTIHEQVNARAMLNAHKQIHGNDYTFNNNYGVANTYLEALNEEIKESHKVLPTEGKLPNWFPSGNKGLIPNITDIKFKDLLPKSKKNVEIDFGRCFRACSMGGWESYWVGHFTFGELINNNYPADVKRRLTIMRELCKGHIWWPTPGYVIASERPTIIKRDDQNRLHSTTGPALAYPDGFGFYYIDGIHVPRKVVMEPANITVDEIKNEGNAAVRRVYIQQYGLRRFLKDTGAKKLDEAPNQQLYHDTIENRRFLICSDGSTGAVYNIQVPLEVNTCQEAQNALAGFNSDRILAQS